MPAWCAKTFATSCLVPGESFLKVLLPISESQQTGQNLQTLAICTKVDTVDTVERLEPITEDIILNTCFANSNPK